MILHIKLISCAAAVCLCATLGVAQQPQPEQQKDRANQTSPKTSEQKPSQDTKQAERDRRDKQDPQAEKVRADAASAAKPATASADEQALMQIERQVSEALVKGDTEALERMWAADYSLTNPGGNVTPKAELIAALKSGDLKFESLTSEDMKVRIDGDTAEVTGRVTVKGKHRDEIINEVDKYTATYKRQDGQWRLVSTKVTGPAGPPQSPQQKPTQQP